MDTVTSISTVEYLRLRNMERRISAIVGYYSDEDIAAHIRVEYEEEEEISEGITIRKVWVNRKLVRAIRELRRELKL